MHVYYYGLDNITRAMVGDVLPQLVAVGGYYVMGKDNGIDHSFLVGKQFCS